MKWFNVTCSSSRWITSAQQHLLKKYVSRNWLEHFQYIDVEDKPLNQWCFNVLKGLKNTTASEIMFGLDDYLPIDNLNVLAIVSTLTQLDREGVDWERLAIGWGCSRTKHTIDKGSYVQYTHYSPYRVSCQFSIWKTDALRRVLSEVDGSPWDFEKKGVCKAFALKEPAFRWIEESALSKRWEGKVNVNGLSREDVEELIKFNLLDRNNLINLSQK